MKKLLLFMAIALTVSIFPLTAYADGHHHDRAWTEHHERVWKDHERQWREHDREWLAHHDDREWREEHVRLWHDWYQWHKDNESVLHVHVSLGSDGGPNLDIDYTK